MRSTASALLSLITATSAWAQSPALDACSVLTRAEITALSGNQDPGAPDPGGSGDMTTCRWGGATPTARIALLRERGSQ